MSTLHTRTPHPMHMHTVAQNRLQDDLCNLCRLHSSLCQHTQSPLTATLANKRTCNEQQPFRAIATALARVFGAWLKWCPHRTNTFAHMDGHEVGRSAKRCASTHTRRQQEAMLPFSSKLTGQSRPYSVDTCISCSGFCSENRRSGALAVVATCTCRLSGVHDRLAD